MMLVSIPCYNLRIKETVAFFHGPRVSDFEVPLYMSCVEDLNPYLLSR